MEKREALKFKKIRKRSFLWGISVSVLLLWVMVASLGLGAVDISYTDVLKIIIGKVTGNHAFYEHIKPGMTAVIWNIRLPRILCSAFVGAGLSMAGAVFQSVLQNPLADPYTLGISTGAAFGASLAIILNIIYGIIVPISVFALLFALFTLFTVIKISLCGGGLITSNLIIGGIIVSSVLTAGISFMKMLAGENVSAIIFWIMGSMSGVTIEGCFLIIPVVIVTGILCCIFSDDLNVMTLGSRNAYSLGVNVKFKRLFFLIMASLITAVCVSVCGVIGFIGLVVPHIIRLSLSGDNKVIVPLSALTGGFLLCGADNVARLISNGEIPVGVLTTLLGGPFFILIFLRRKGGLHHE